jgi:hypothetical protein
MSPGLVWLLLIPLFNLVWKFFVFLQVAQSCKDYFFRDQGRDIGDTEWTIELIYAIAAVLSMVPYLNCLAGPAALVLLIVFLVRVNNLKNQVPDAAAD